MSPAQAAQKIPLTFAFREFVFGIPTNFVVHEPRPRAAKRPPSAAPWHPMPGVVIPLKAKSPRIHDEEFA